MKGALGMGDVRMRRRSILKGMGAVLALQADFLPGFTEEPQRGQQQPRTATPAPKEKSIFYLVEKGSFVA